MQITWNVRLTKTAGYCYYKKGMMHNNNNKRISRIELSDKVCDSAGKNHFSFDRSKRKKRYLKCRTS